MSLGIPYSHRVETARTVQSSRQPCHHQAAGSFWCDLTYLNNDWEGWQNVSSILQQMHRKWNRTARTSCGSCALCGLTAVFGMGILYLLYVSPPPGTKETPASSRRSCRAIRMNWWPLPSPQLCQWTSRFLLFRLLDYLVSLIFSVLFYFVFKALVPGLGAFGQLALLFLTPARG